MITYPEKVPQKIAKDMTDLELRIMQDIIRRVYEAGRLSSTANWQIEKLKLMGESEDFIQKAVQRTLKLTDDDVKQIFSDTARTQYKGNARLYKATGKTQIPFSQNESLQASIEAVTRQTQDTLQNITRQMGFVTRGADRLYSQSVSQYYRKTLDNAMYDIQSGAFDLNTVLNRTINQMTSSGVRWIDYATKTHNRIDVASRRAIMTGFRQLQTKISDQTAEELGTEMFEVSMHGGARPEHQEWQGKVYTKDELYSICGLGEVTGLCGVNCYHTYWPFIPGVDTRTYTDEQVEEFNQSENEPKDYNGTEYTKYEALQEQRSLETQIRAVRERISLGQLVNIDEDIQTENKAKYTALMSRYKAFSASMGLPVQRDRLTQNNVKIRVN